VRYDLDIAIEFGFLRSSGTVNSRLKLADDKEDGEVVSVRTASGRGDIDMVHPSTLACEVDHVRSIEFGCACKHHVKLRHRLAIRALHERPSSRPTSPRLPVLDPFLDKISSVKHGVRTYREGNQEIWLQSFSVNVASERDGALPMSLWCAITVVQALVETPEESDFHAEAYHLLTQELKAGEAIHSLFETSERISNAATRLINHKVTEEMLRVACGLICGKIKCKPQRRRKVR
jgi:hypothetical protein